MFSWYTKIVNRKNIWQEIPSKTVYLILLIFIITTIIVSRHLCSFYQCFGNSRSCVQIKSIYYCNNLSVKLKYLNSYDYIFHPMFSIKSWKGSNSRCRESMSVSYQNNQTSKEIGVDISIFVGTSVLYWHVVKQSFIFLQLSFQPLIVLLSPMELWHTVSS